jgi:hypothetical protein
VAAPRYKLSCRWMRAALPGCARTSVDPRRRGLACRATPGHAAGHRSGAARVVGIFGAAHPTMPTCSPAPSTKLTLRSCSHSTLPRTPCLRDRDPRRCSTGRHRPPSAERAGSVGLNSIQLLLLPVFVQVGVSVESNFLGSVQSLMDTSILGTTQRITMTCQDAYR